MEAITANIIPFPARTAPHTHLALARQLAHEASGERRAWIEARIHDPLGEAASDPILDRLAAIEAKLDALAHARKKGVKHG